MFHRLSILLFAAAAFACRASEPAHDEAPPSPPPPPPCAACTDLDAAWQLLFDGEYEAARELAGAVLEAMPPGDDHQRTALDVTHLADGVQAVFEGRGEDAFAALDQIEDPALGRSFQEGLEQIVTGRDGR